MNWTQWVVDVTLWEEGGLYCFVPLEGDPQGEHTLVVGMNFLTDRVPGGKLVGVVHMDGQEAVDEWCAAHETELAELAEASS